MDRWIKHRIALYSSGLLEPEECSLQQKRGEATALTQGVMRG
jgi:hypothetical protein